MVGDRNLDLIGAGHDLFLFEKRCNHVNGQEDEEGYEIKDSLIDQICTKIHLRAHTPNEEHGQAGLFVVVLFVIGLLFDVHQPFEKEHRAGKEQSQHGPELKVLNGDLMTKEKNHHHSSHYDTAHRSYHYILPILRKIK
jgi:hypothetical protein